MNHASRISRFERVKAEAPRLKECGYSVKSIAVYLNVQPADVYYALRSVGIRSWKWGEGAPESESHKAARIARKGRK